MSNRRAMLAKIHIAKKELGLDDEIYRNMLENSTGKRSAGCMSDSELIDVLNCFKKSGWLQKIGNKNSFRKISTKAYVRKIYVLWGLLKSGKVVKARFPDGFVRRMIGVENTEWVNPQEGNIIIEALKNWCDRENVHYED